MKETSYSKLDCRAGTFRRNKVKIVTNPNALAANHSGTAAHPMYHQHAKKQTIRFRVSHIC